MTYNYICFFQLIHHQVSISNSPIVLMILKNGLFIIIFSLIPPKLRCWIILHLQLTNISANIINLQIIIYLELEKYENQLLYFLLKL